MVTSACVTKHVYPFRMHVKSIQLSAMVTLTQHIKYHSTTESEAQLKKRAGYVLLCAPNTITMNLLPILKCQAKPSLQKWETPTKRHAIS
jgi:hypothetical protein